MIVKHVNANPRILNPEYDGKSDESIENSFFSMIPLKKSTDVKHFDTIKDILRVKKPYIDINEFIRTRGSMSENIKLLINNNFNESSNSIKVFEQIVMKQIAELTKANDNDDESNDSRSLSGDTNRKIDELFAEMRLIDCELNKTLRYIATYIDMYDKIRHKDSSGESISFEEIGKKLLEHNKEFNDVKTIKQQCNDKLKLADNDDTYDTVSSYNLQYGGAKTMSLSVIKSFVDRYNKLSNKYQMKENSVGQVVIALNGLIHDVIVGDYAEEVEN
jgi:hypothetical protein